MKTVKIISMLSILIVLTNLTVSKTFAQDQEKTQTTEASKLKSSNDSQTSLNQAAVYNRNNERYRIGYQDTVEVTVSKHPELSLNVSVNPDGTIFLPRLNAPVIAACKTEIELKENITALYKQNYLRDPFVSVRVSDQRSQGFAVIGAVEKPGNFYLNRKVHLLELLALAGGHDVEFAGGKIQVARTGSDSSCKSNTDAEAENDLVFFSYRLADVTEGKQNPLMQPGDIISVLKSEEAYVIGNVYKPAKVPLDEPKTLTQAIAFAGGRAATASDKVVIRRQANGAAMTKDLLFSLSDIEKKKIADPQLQANDIVDVGTDKIKTVRNGLLKAITGGLGNVFYRIP